MAAELKKDSIVVYLYGVTESEPHAAPNMTGVDRIAKVESIECDGIFCWVSRVSAQDFGKDLARNMENLDWLAETSVTHQRVIGAIGSKADILPCRLGTVFRTEASLSKHVLARVRAFKRDFARIKGADEWGVKVFDVQPVVSTLPEIHDGKDYLKAKAALLPSRRRKSRADGSEILKFAQALEKIASESAPTGNVSRGQRGLAFQRTLLVPRSNKRKLESVLEKFARDWENERRIECTGPWPPYSFVSRPGDGVRAR